MKNFLVLLFLASLPTAIFAQSAPEAEEVVDTTWKKVLRESYPMTNEKIGRAHV